MDLDEKEMAVVQAMRMDDMSREAIFQYAMRFSDETP